MPEKLNSWDEAAWKAVIDKMRSFSPKAGPKPRNMKIDDMMGNQTVEPDKEVNIAALEPSFALGRRLSQTIMKYHEELSGLVAKHDAFTNALQRGRLSMQVELRIDGREWPISIDGKIVEGIMAAEINKLAAAIQEKHKQIQELAKQLAES